MIPETHHHSVTPFSVTLQLQLRCMPNSDNVYVCSAASGKLKRKSYFVDERALNRAKKVLGVETEAEVIRLSVERVNEMEEFWEFMSKTRRSLKPGSIVKP